VSVEPADVLINITGDSVARCAIAGSDIGPARVNQHVAIIRPNNRLCPGFLQRVLVAQGMKAHLLSLSRGGGTRKALTKADLSELKIPVPPLSIQQSIAEVLQSFDDKIAANRDAERRKADLIALHYDRAVKHQRHEVAFFAVFDVTYGEPFKGTQFAAPEIGRPLIRIRDLKTQSPKIWTTETRPGETVIRPGEVLVGMDAEFRPTWWLGSPGLLNQRVCRIKKRPLAAIEGYKTGTTVIHLNKSDLMSTQVVIPEIDATRDARPLADALLESRVQDVFERQRLETLRDALLPGLMSGRIKVKDAEDRVGEVL
jgi:type I restriction enzyme, S subunit